jgi:hypothetical protein
MAGHFPKSWRSSRKETEVKQELNRPELDAAISLGEKSLAKYKFLRAQPATSRKRQLDTE